MSMPQVLLSIRQGRHGRFELVRGGSGGGQAGDLVGKRSAARQVGRPGLSQYQQVAEPSQKGTIKHENS